MRNRVRHGVGCDDHAVDAPGQVTNRLGSTESALGQDDDDALAQICGRQLMARDELGPVGTGEVCQHEPVRLVPRSDVSSGAIGW